MNSYNYNCFDPKPKILLANNTTVPVDEYIGGLNVEHENIHFLNSQLEIRDEFNCMIEGEKIVLYGFSSNINTDGTVGIYEEYFLTNYSRFLVYTYVYGNNINNGHFEMLNYRYWLSVDEINLIRNALDSKYPDVFKCYKHYYAENDGKMGIPVSNIISMIYGIKQKNKLGQTK